MTYPTPILHFSLYADINFIFWKCCSFSVDVPKVLLSGKKRDFRKSLSSMFVHNIQKAGLYGRSYIRCCASLIIIYSLVGWLPVFLNIAQISGAAILSAQISLHLLLNFFTFAQKKSEMNFRKTYPLFFVYIAIYQVFKMLKIWRCAKKNTRENFYYTLFIL